MSGPPDVAAGPDVGDLGPLGEAGEDEEGGTSEVGGAVLSSSCVSGEGAMLLLSALSFTSCRGTSPSDPAGIGIGGS